MPKQPMNAGEWFWRGDQFMSASTLLYKHSIETGEHIPLPEVSSKAFAAECYLKCLLRLRKKNAMEGEHHLLRLFKELPHTDRIAIQAAWDPVMLPKLDFAAKNLPQHLKMMAIPRTLLQALKQNGDAFKEWRYRIKLQGTWFLGPFPQAVRGRIIEIHPDWGTSPPDMSYSPHAEL